MSQKLLFHGKTAIITGAAGGTGRSYVLDLAARGCNIVVNDIGCAVTGDKALGNSDSAAALAKEIVQNGGKAVPNYNSVLEGQKIVDHAISAFGSVDILINNAGIIRDRSFLKMAEKDWNDVLDVHLNGTFQMCHAVWPKMMASNYGRIINIGSRAGLYGNFGICCILFYF